MSGPAKLSPTHHEIMRWLLENPGRPQRECAERFDITETWLSCIIHCDAFQSKLAEMQREADVIVLADIPTKLRGVASRALDGLADQVEDAVNNRSIISREFLAETVDKTLHRLGYGAAASRPAGPAAPTMNFYGNTQVVNADLLKDARESMLLKSPEKVIDAVEVAPAPAQ